MECIYCQKVFKSPYILSTHQKTAKSCIKIQEDMGNIVDKKSYPCEYCEKEYTSSYNVLHHKKTCKKKLKHDQDKLQEELKKTKYTQRIIEQSLRQKEAMLEDELSQLASDVRNNKEEIQFELKIKDEKITNLVEQLHDLQKKLEEKTKTSSSITNNQTTNYNLTIHNYMTPERVTEIFDKHYTIETLMGGQKALANFVVDQFVSGKDKMIYLCVDRSRKKCMYTKDFQTFHEDVNNELLLSQLSPAMRVIKDKVDWTEYERKYNPHVTKIHESFDEILAIPDDGTIFRSQLCRRLPSSMDEKNRMDQSNESVSMFHDLRQEEERQFIGRKDEIEQMVSKPEEEDPAVHMVPNQIEGVSLGRLDPLRLLFKNQGIYKIYSELKEAVEKIPDIAQAYEDYIKRGMYKGIVIWE